MRPFEPRSLFLSFLSSTVGANLPSRPATAVRRVPCELQFLCAFNGATLARQGRDRCGNQTDQVRSYFDIPTPNLFFKLIVTRSPKLIELRRIGLPSVIDAFKFVTSPQGGAVKHEDRASSLIIIPRQGGPVCGDIGERPRRDFCWN